MPNRPKISKVDEYGIKEYNPLFLFLMLLAILYGAIWLLSFPLLEAEMGAENANIKTFGDAFWTLQMAASTIGFGDHFPVTNWGRAIVAFMFYIGMGVAGGIAGIVLGVIMSFSDTAVKNRELRKQNAEIIEQNARAIELEEQGIELDERNKLLNARILAKLEDKPVDVILEEIEDELNGGAATVRRDELEEA